MSKGRSDFVTSVKITWHLVGDNKLKFIFACFLTLIGNLDAIILPIFIGLVVDFFINYETGQSLNVFYMYCILISLIFIIASFVRTIGKNMGSYVANETRYRARMRFFDIFMSSSLSWHSKETIGSKMQRVNSSSEAMRKQIRLVTSNLTMIIVSVVGIPLSVFFLNPYYSLFFIGYYIIMFIIIYYYIGKIKQAYLEYNIAKEKASAKYFEALNSISSIKSLGAKDEIRKHVDVCESLSRDKSMKIRDISQSMVKVVQLINGISMGLFLLLIGNGIVTKIITIGLIATYFAYLTSAMGKIFDVFGIIIDSTENQSEIARSSLILYSEDKKFFGKKSFPRKWKKISFNAKKFSYGKEDVLGNIKFIINRKDKIAFVGKTGSGKSTIGKILLGLYRLEEGKIHVDGVDYYKISHDDILKNITVVSQDIEIFNVSLKDNITMFNNKVDIKEIIKISSLDDLVKKLPEGIDTLIGEKGYRLSGGERQRVGIARALYKGSDIIILDEATSSLDAKTEKDIIDKIYKIKNKTFIIIAHRLSTIKNADKIYVIDKGMIKESGSFDELIKKKGAFERLYRNQK